MENYIGLILDERNDHYTIGYGQTSDLKKLKEWKKEMLECSNVIDCKILKVEEIKQSSGGKGDAKRLRLEWNGQKITVHKLGKQPLRNTFQ